MRFLPSRWRGIKSMLLDILKRNNCFEPKYCFSVSVWANYTKLPWMINVNPEEVCSLCLPDYAEKAVKTVNLIVKSSCLHHMQFFIFWGWRYGYCRKESYCGSICPKGTFFSQHQQSICFTFFFWMQFFSFFFQE